MEHSEKAGKEPHLRVFLNRTSLVDENGMMETFTEGPPCDDAKERLARIRKRLENGWFDNLIEDVVKGERASTLDLSERHRESIDGLVSGLTSEVGRSVVGLTVLQLTVKALEPAQSIRLHKGGRGNFSWSDGLPMRSLDADFITPALRRFELIRLNIYGFMMTRSLAENYPYSHFYKAAIRGGKMEWLNIVDELEEGNLNAEEGLVYLISILSNKSLQFQQLAEETVTETAKLIDTKPSLEAVVLLISNHIQNATYSSRLLEVAMHSLFQVASDRGALEGPLLPLCQMRTANKKHRNVGDIEVVSAPGSHHVIEAWDAKFGKINLRDEIEELNDKLQVNTDVVTAGFVTDQEPQITEDIRIRLEEIQDEYGTRVMIVSFSDWVNVSIERIGEDYDQIGRLWLLAYVESLCQKRRDLAPIDEPSDEWVKSLKKELRRPIRKLL